MQCKDIEQLIIGLSGKHLNREELSYLERHLSSCERCACFKEDLNRIRQGLEAMPIPQPSDDLVRQTRFKCYTKLKTMHVGKSIDISHVSVISGSIWAMLFILIALTLIWSVSLLKNFNVSQPLSSQTIAVLAIMIQNGVMLCFAPLLIGKCRLGNRRYKSIFVG